MSATSLRGLICTAAALATLCLCLSPAMPAQELHDRSPDAKPAAPTTPPLNPVFKTTVRRVILDVVVTERATKKAVRGLTEKDFFVVEDGKTQRILSFDEHDLETDADISLQKPPVLPPNTFINVPVGKERGPLYVLLLDLVNTEVADQPYARGQLLKFVEAKPEGTRFAVFVLSDKVQLVQGFTTDKALLTATLDPKSSRAHVPMIFLYGANFGRGENSMMVGIFEHLAHYLDGLPGRKNVIWFSGRFPLSLFPSKDDVESYRNKLKDTLDTMARNQIALYTVDASCLPFIIAHAPEGDTGGGGLYSDFRTGAAGAPGASAGSTAGGSGGGGGVGYNMQNNQYMVADAITQATGGHAYYSTNDLAGALEEATEAGGNYYTLTYSPSNLNYDGNLRNIHIAMEKRGYELAYRRSYYGEDPAGLKHPGQEDQKQFAVTDQTAPTALAKSLAANIQHGAPMEHQLLLRASLHATGAPAMASPQQMAVLAGQPAYFHPHKGNTPAKPPAPIKVQTIAIDYTVIVPPVQAQPSIETAPNLQFAAVAYDVDGRVLNNVIQNSAEANTTGGSDAAQKGIYRAQQQIDVPAGASSLRIGVRDISTDRMGTIEVPLPLAPVPPTQAASEPSSHPAAVALPENTKPN